MDGWMGVHINRRMKVKLQLKTNLCSQHGYLNICHRVNSGNHCAKIKGRTNWAGKTEWQDNPEGPFEECLCFMLSLFLNKIQTKQQPHGSKDWHSCPHGRTLGKKHGRSGRRTVELPSVKWPQWWGSSAAAESNAHHSSILSCLELIPSSFHNSSSFPRQYLPLTQGPVSAVLTSEGERTGEKDPWVDLPVSWWHQSADRDGGEAEDK